MARERPTYQDRIVSDPQIMAGKAVIIGTRIPVEKVLDQLAYNPDVDELFTVFLELALEDVKACLSYAQAVVANRSHPPRHAADRSAV